MKFVLGIFTCICLTLIYIGSLAPVYAQNIGSGVAQYVNVSGSPQDGMVVCASDSGNVLCNRGYDPGMAGVVSLSPAATFGSASPSAGLVPIIASGNAYVVVSGANGAITPGDALKATNTG